MKASCCLWPVLQPNKLFPKNMGALALKHNPQERYCTRPYVPISVGRWEPDFLHCGLANTDAPIAPTRPPASCPLHLFPWLTSGLKNSHTFSKQVLSQSRPPLELVLNKSFLVCLTLSSAIFDITDQLLSLTYCWVANFLKAQHFTL